MEEKEADVMNLALIVWTNGSVNMSGIVIIRNGGGSKVFAQGGGTDISKLSNILQETKDYIRNTVI